MPSEKSSFPLVRPAALRLSLLLLPLLGGAAHAQNATYTFDAGNADFQANFSRTSRSGNTGWGYLSSGGIGGSGAVVPPGSTDSNAVFLQALPNTPGTTITLSIYGRFGSLQSEGIVGNDLSDAFGIGLVNSTSGYAGEGGAGAGNSLLSYLTRSDSDNGATATATGVTLSTVAYQGSNFVGSSGSSNANTITPGNWYRITDTINIQSGTLQVTSTVADYGASGNSLTPSSLVATTGTVTNPFTGSVFYAALYGGTSGGTVAGAKALDNFSQIAASSAPEPAALALLLPMLPLAAVRLRPNTVARRKPLTSKA